MRKFAIFQVRSIRFKLLLYFLFLILFPIITLGFLGTAIYSRAVEDEITAHTTQMIGQVQNNTELNIRDMENIIYYISNEPQIVKFLNSIVHSITLKKNAKDILITFSEFHPEIAGIMIVNPYGIYETSEMYTIARYSLDEESWYSQAVASPNTLQLIGKPIGGDIVNRMGYDDDEVVSVIKAVRVPGIEMPKGVIVIFLKLEAFKNSIEGVTFGKTGFVYIADAKGDIVYKPANPIVEQVDVEWLRNNPTNSIVKTIDNNRYQIIYEDSEFTGWKTVGVFSLDETLEQVSNIRNLSLMVGGLTLVFAFIAALFFASSIAKPVGELRSLMKEAERGNLDVQFKSKYNDEISQLGDSFNNMISEIRKLIGLVYKEQTSKREAELKTLQAQIKPHFLYNTLDTIQWMAQGHQANDIVEIVGALTRLFRIGISKGNEMITLGEEIEHIKSYLIIQKVRYEEKLHYEINFQEEIMNFHIVKLILQPLVENAIYHGIKQKRGPGMIVIDVRKKDGKLCFRIRDNGIGILPEKMIRIQETMTKENPDNSNEGFGIFNVRERIRLSFGNEYGVFLHSVFGEGTVVEVWHPIIE